MATDRRRKDPSSWLPSPRCSKATSTARCSSACGPFPCTALRARGRSSDSAAARLSASQLSSTTGSSSAPVGGNAGGLEQHGQHAAVAGGGDCGGESWTPLRLRQARGCELMVIAPFEAKWACRALGFCPALRPPQLLAAGAPQVQGTVRYTYLLHPALTAVRHAWCRLARRPQRCSRPQLPMDPCTAAQLKPWPACFYNEGAPNRVQCAGWCRAQAPGRAGAALLSHALPLVCAARRLVRVLLPLGSLHARQHVLLCGWVGGWVVLCTGRRVVGQRVSSKSFQSVTWRRSAGQQCGAQEPPRRSGSGHHPGRRAPCRAAHLLGLHAALQLQQLDDLALQWDGGVVERAGCGVQGAAQGPTHSSRLRAGQGNWLRPAPRLGTAHLQRDVGSAHGARGAARECVLLDLRQRALQRLGRPVGCGGWGGVGWRKTWGER